jgi:DNA ligase (NAD+)
MNIDGMGEALVDQLVDRGIVRSVADIYDLTIDKLLALERIGPKSAGNLIRNIDSSKKNPMPRVLAALGIRFVGERTAKFLADHFTSIDRIATATLDELQDSEEVGPKVAESIFRFFEEPRNQELVERLRSAGLQFEFVGRRPKQGPLNGLVFVLTGTLPHLAREDAKRMIEAAGGKISGSVSSKTHYVVAGEDAGSKLDKARKLGVTVIGEDQFLELIKIS